MFWSLELAVIKSKFSFGSVLSIQQSQKKKKKIEGNEFSRRRKSKLCHCHSKHDKTTETGNFKLSGSWLKQLPSIMPGKFTPNSDSFNAPLQIEWNKEPT